jgi:Domain of unknown function (DUF397)
MAQMPQPPAIARWQKSKRSNEGTCAEVARTHDHAWIRDSKNASGPVLGFTRKAWAAFIDGLRRNDFGRV